MSKIGRNDMCPCGSGIKYKRCCLPRKHILAPRGTPAQRRGPRKRNPLLLATIFAAVASKIPRDEEKK